MMEMIGSIDSNNKIVPSTMMFVSGGTFDFGNEGSMVSSTSSKPGSILTYTIDSKKEDFREKKEIVPDLPKESSKEDETMRISNMEALSVEMRLRNEAREAAKAERSTKAQKTSIPTSLSYTRTSSNLRINGLPGWWSSQTLLQDFSCYGHVVSTKIVALRFDDRRPTCGYILYGERSCAERAKFERDESQYAGAVVTLEFVPPPSEMASLKKARPNYKNINKDHSNKNPFYPIVEDYLRRETDELQKNDFSHFLDLLQNLSPSRSSIISCSHWMIENDTYASHATQLWADTICNESNSVVTYSKRLSLLFVASDLLNNINTILKATHHSFEGQNGNLSNLASSTDFKNLWVYKASFYQVLNPVFRYLGRQCNSIPGRISSSFFSSQINSVISSWRKSGIFTPIFLDSLSLAFKDPDSKPIDMTKNESQVSSQRIISIDVKLQKKDEKKDNLQNESIDGVPICDYRGLPIDFEEFLEAEILRLQRSGEIVKIT